MTRTKGLALTFYITAVVAGVAIGVAADRYLLARGATRLSGRALRDQFARELRLTTQQRSAVDQILDARSRAESVLVFPIRPQLDSIRAEARQKISSVLTPDQQHVYQQMQRDQKARAQEKR